MAGRRVGTLALVAVAFSVSVALLQVLAIWVWGPGAAWLALPTGLGFGLVLAALRELNGRLGRQLAEYTDADVRLRLLVEQMPAVVYLGDVEGDLAIRFIGPQVEELTGVPAERWTSGQASWTSLIHPDDRQYVLAAYRQTRAHGLPFNAEYRIHSRDGRTVWIHHRARVVSADAGRAAQIQGVLMDVSDRRQVEDALRESELRYRTLIETSPDAITVTDLRGRILMGNGRSRELHGLRGQSRLIGRSMYDFVVPQDRAVVANAVMRAAGGTSPERVAYEALNERLGQVPVELTISAIRDPDGQAIALMGVSRDTSERLAAEQARRESEEKSRFLATMSHELRTPLNSILGFSQLLNSGNFGRLDERQARYLGHIESSGRHLLELVSEILDFSKAAAGHLRVARERVDVGSVLDESLARVKAQADLKGIDLGRTVEGAPQALADPERVSQVLVNLLSNAVKFTESGGRVAVAAEVDADSVLLTVSDTGIGIPPDQQERVFNEFVQVESGRSRNQEGTGLGLALSRRLAEQMGGSIRLVSAVGEGSTFAVRLPALYDLSDDGEADPRAGDSPPVSPPLRALGGHTEAR